MMSENLRHLESDTASAANVDALTLIWEHVLQRSNIGPEDRFDDLGGTDPQADRIFAEIAKVFDRELPTATICHAQTIAALATLLQQPSLPRFPALVKLKAGNEKTPILIAPGLDGRARFSKLAKYIRTEHAIYGMQAKGVDGLEEPFERIEDMAQYYLEALGQLQPQGSCILIGYSFGGLVALEMARRLSAEGKAVAQMALVETYPHPRYLSPGQRLWLIARRLRRHIREMTRRPAGDAFSYFMRGLKRRLHLAGVRRAAPLPPEKSRLSFAQTTFHVQEKSYTAYRHYRPRFYRGKIKFVQAGVNFYFPDDPAAVWGRLTDEFEVKTVPGNHLDMVTDEFEGLAAALTEFLRGASCPE
jgi:acetoacetyl-CoA synthetase